MTTELPTPDDGEPADSGETSEPQSEQVRHSPVSARVPERIAAGVFSTGAVVLQGQHEFILDFLLRMSQPQQVAARVVLPPAVTQQFIQALDQNIQNYEKRFGPIHMPGGQQQSPPTGGKQSAADLYDQLKLPDEKLSGVYANAVMIGHSPSEFSFDFITTFFPRSAVSCRVFLASPNARRLLDALRHSFAQFQQKQRPGPHEPPPGA